METARNIARRLLEIEAVKLRPAEPFTWASGLRSPIYCDNRVLLSYPDFRREVIRAFVEQLDGAGGAVAGGKVKGNIGGVAGVATAGIPHGALLAEALNLPFVYIRSQAKTHGRQNQIEGRLQANTNYLVVEDLISTGGSSLRAIEALRAAGGQVAAAVAIFSYEFPAAQRAFEQAEVPLLTLSGYRALLEEAVAGNYITAEEQTTLTNWREDPRAWSERFEQQ